MEHYLEIVSVARTAQIRCLLHAVLRGKAAFQARMESGQTHRGTGPLQCFFVFLSYLPFTLLFYFPAELRGSRNKAFMT